MLGNLPLERNATRFSARFFILPHLTRPPLLCSRDLSEPLHRSSLRSGNLGSAETIPSLTDKMVFRLQS